MRFENRTLGVFEVLGVHLEADQSFDAGRLRQETLRLVEKGSRRIVVDLGSIDYLYSDSINAFVALNRRLLESSGRLGILVPHPKVHEILVRAGLENIMRLYRTEAELMGDSRELMRQSSAWTRPVELLNEASASQILSATNLVARSEGGGRDAQTSFQRIPRRRTGPRAEIKSRRHDGRRMDQPAEDMPLPPVLPGVGSESASLRNLSLDSSTFGLPSPATSEEWKPSEQVVKTAPPVLPSAEPTVFQLPQDPEQDGYSTDAWLLALTAQPISPDPRPTMDQDSSGFLPKLGVHAAAPSRELPQAPLADPPSRIDTDLRWEEEISLTDGPVSPTKAAQAPTPPPKAVPEQFAPVADDPYAGAFLDAPPSRAASPGAKPNLLSGDDALRNAIFHDAPGAPPPARRSPAPPVASPAPVGMGNPDAEPTLAIPAAAVSKAAPAGSPPDPAAFAETKTSSSAEDWFGSVKRASPPPTSVPSAGAVGPAIAQAKSSAPALPPTAPVRVEPKFADPESESKGSSLASDWFAQPAPRLMVPARDRPLETDEWFGTRSAASPAAQAPAMVPSPPPPDPKETPKAPHLAAPSAAQEDWFRQPSTPSPRAPGHPQKKQESSFLDTDDLDPPSSKRRGIGFWVALVVGAVLVLGGIAVLVVGLSKRAPDVPPVTAPASQAPPDPSSSSRSPQPPDPEPVADAGKGTGVARTKPVKSGSVPVAVPAASPAPAPTPAPPPEEEHAPVKVFVTSRPSGAALALDGKNVGTTPCEITVKRNGTLDFALAGYRPFHRTIDPDEIHGTLNVQLLSDGGGASAGRIYISSSPSGADIQYGGRSLGKTPRLVDLPTGTQKVTVKSGSQSQTKTLDIQSGTNPSENFSL